jgi:hypothetical protein
MQNNKPHQQKWPSELDALLAAPQHHRLLFENEMVRVIDARIPPGETTALHTHQWPASLYIISMSDFIRYDAEGRVTFDSRTMPIALLPSMAIWSEPIALHALQNTGLNELRVICVEIKKTSENH